MKNCFSVIGLIVFLISLGLPTKNWGQNIGATWVVPPVLEIEKFEFSPKVDDSRFVVQKKALYGLCDKSGKFLLPLAYSGITLYSCGWILASKEGKWLLFNANIEPVGTDCERFVMFNNGTAVAYKNRLCGLINQKGEVLVPIENQRFTQRDQHYVFIKDGVETLFKMPAEYVSPNVQRMEDAKARAVVAGHYFVKKSNNECGLLNLKRDTVVPPVYRFGAISESGFIAATLDGKTWGIIDVKHKTLYPFTADRMGSTWTKSGLIPVRFEKQWALMRFPKAEIVIPFGEYELIEVYDAQKDLFLVTKNKLKGMINVKRKELLPCAYTYISEAAHVTTDLIGENNKHGFWNRATNYLQAPIYKNVLNLSDSLVVVLKDSTQAVIDSRNGKIVIPFAKYELDRSGNYFNSHRKTIMEYSATYAGHVHALYDRKGNLVFPHDSVDIYVVPDNNFWVCPQFHDASKFCELRTPNGKVLLTTPKIGAKLEKFGYDLAYIMNGNGLSIANKIFYLDEQGNEKYYDYIENSKENLRRVRVGTLYGFIDTAGKQVIPPVLEVAEESVDGYIRVKYQGKWGVLQNPKFEYFEQFEKMIKK